MKQLVQAVKGTRDFYPEDMAFRNWLYGKIKKVSERFGYQEFDGPYIEYLDLYSDKTSEEILKEQAFSLKDRDGRDILLRPEITPTMARMVAQKSQELPKPIRWWSFGRGYRYEQPQKGRTREFFQWEINLLGPETPEADAEIIALAAEYFKELGLSSKEVVIKVSDRSYFQKILKDNNIADEKTLSILRILDRVMKISDDEFIAELSQLLEIDQVMVIKGYINDKTTKSKWLDKVWASLEKYPGVLDYVIYEPAIVRGFDYYTRTVFEAWDRSENLQYLKRSLFGGGRFDNLTETLGGEKIPGVGMAPGDVPIQVLLEELGKMPDLRPKVAKVLVTRFNDDLLEKTLECASLLRENNIDTEAWLENSKLDKQFKYADEIGIPYVVVIGPDEAKNNQVTLKDLKNKTQETLAIDELLAKLK